MNPTAWLIDKDHLFEPGDDPSDNEAGTTGPHNAPDVLLQRLVAGGGVKFRMYDDDDVLYYTGRIIALDDDGGEQTGMGGWGEEFFRPLWDFGTPNAGAVDIRYRDAGKWVSL